MRLVFVLTSLFYYDKLFQSDIYLCLYSSVGRARGC